VQSNDDLHPANPGLMMTDIMATESTDGHGNTSKRGLFFSCFFRGFRGHREILTLDLAGQHPLFSSKKERQNNTERKP
jgi:hypothetical protein